MQFMSGCRYPLLGDGLAHCVTDVAAPTLATTMAATAIHCAPVRCSPSRTRPQTAATTGSRLMSTLKMRPSNRRKAFISSVKGNALDRMANAEPSVPIIHMKRDDL